VTLRARLALANLALLALILSAFGTGVYAYVDTELHDGFETSMRNTAEHLGQLVQTVRTDNQSDAGKDVRERLKSARLPETLAWAVETAPQDAILFKSDTLPQDSSPPRIQHNRMTIMTPSDGTVQPTKGASSGEYAFYTMPFELMRPVSQAERRTEPGNTKQRGDRAILRGALTVARPVEVVEGPLRLLRTILIGGGILALVAAALLGFGVSSALLRPLERMRAVAQRIGGERNFHLRLPVGNRRHELGRLAVTMNQMLGELDKAHASLQATLDAQRRFVADASHELRTPVTAIRTNVEFLERAPNARADDRAEALADVLSEVRRMEHLVGDLLALARLEAAAAHVHYPLRLDHLLGDVHRDAVRQAQANVEVTLAPLPEVWVAGDREDLRRAIWNLAENALKYTGSMTETTGSAGRAGQGRRGGGKKRTQQRPDLITLSLAVVEGSAVIKVTDTGIGIAACDRPFVFDRFWRAQEVRGRSGSGLGLAITKWVAQAHGGSVEVESTAGEGSTFTMRLPVGRRPSTELVGPVRASAGASAAGASAASAGASGEGGSVEGASVDRDTVPA
jgi:signal transduction histidine kinase